MGAFNMYIIYLLISSLYFSYVEKTGTYKLDVVNLQYHFDPVKSVIFI